MVPKCPIGAGRNLEAVGLAPSVGRQASQCLCDERVLGNVDLTDHHAAAPRPLDRYGLARDLSRVRWAIVMASGPASHGG